MVTDAVGPLYMAYKVRARSQRLFPSDSLGRIHPHSWDLSLTQLRSREYIAEVLFHPLSTVLGRLAAIKWIPFTLANGVELAVANYFS